MASRCPAFIKGTCKNGPNCKFGTHPEDANQCLAFTFSNDLLTYRSPSPHSFLGKRKQMDENHKTDDQNQSSLKKRKISDKEERNSDDEESNNEKDKNENNNNPKNTQLRAKPKKPKRKFNHSVKQKRYDHSQKKSKQTTSKSKRQSYEDNAHNHNHPNMDNAAVNINQTVSINAVADTTDIFIKFRRSAFEIGFERWQDSLEKDETMRSMWNKILSKVSIDVLRVIFLFLVFNKINDGQPMCRLYYTFLPSPVSPLDGDGDEDEFEPIRYKQFSTGEIIDKNMAYQSVFQVQILKNHCWTLSLGFVPHKMDHQELPETEILFRSDPIEQSEKGVTLWRAKNTTPQIKMNYQIMPISITSTKFMIGIVWSNGKMGVIINEQVLSRKILNIDKSIAQREWAPIEVEIDPSNDTNMHWIPVVLLENVKIKQLFNVDLVNFVMSQCEPKV